MEWLRSQLKLSQWGQLALIAAIFFLSFITFNILFRATAGDSYFNEIIAALIGTILAAVVTTMLLRSQTQGEELKERNVEVFRKKVDAYEAFVELSLKLLDDHDLSNDDARQLRRSVYKLSLFSSEDTVATVSRFVRAQFVQDDEYAFSDVISAFRKELALERVGELADLDLDVVDDLLRHRGSRAHIEAAQATLISFAEKLFEELTAQQPDIFEGAAFDEAQGLGHGSFVNLVCASGVQVGFSIDYDAESDEGQIIEAGLDLEELAAKRGAAVRKLAFSLGFEEESDEETANEPGFPVALVNPFKDTRSQGIIDGRRVWSIDEFAKALVQIEREAQVVAKRTSRRKLK